jgi:acylphosphatase
VFSFDKLHLVVPDTASADAYGRENRVVTYRRQIRELAKTLKDKPGESWLVTHQALWVSYAQKKDKTYAEADLYGRVAAMADPTIRADLCGQTISPMNTFRQWIGDKVPLANPNESNPPDKHKEQPCAETGPPAQTVAAPHFSLVLSGDTHTFQMFKPGDTAAKDVPVQLVVGNSGDALEPDSSYSGADKALIPADATLFDVTGKLWMRNTFGFAVLERPDGQQAWTATLYDVDGKAIAHCDLTRSGGGCN